MLRLLIIIFLGTTLIVSCGKDDESGGENNNVMTGQIRGVDFTFGSARYGSISTDLYRVIVSNAGPLLVEPCDSNTKDIYIDFKPKKTTDKINMNPAGASTGPNTVVHHHPDFFENIVIDRTGYYQITMEKDSTLTIEMDYKFDDKNFMKGTFVAARCF